MAGIIKYYCAWWNVENLFDIENSPSRPEWLQKQLSKELKGWNPTVLDHKISQLSKVISLMNDGTGPDILGVCEVESKQVLEKLVSKINLPRRNYGIIHADNSDKRGIDVAFIYDKKVFSYDESAVFHHVILKRNATRDILQVTFKTRNAHEFIMIANHWPSRRGGEQSSEPYRMMAGETLAYWLERIKSIKGDIPVFVMGDFNDEPFNRSMVNYAFSTRSIKKVKSKRSTRPYLYNLMWPLMGKKIATHSYNKVWGMLDQILVNRGGLLSKGIYCKRDAVSIFLLEAMIKNNEPIRFGRPSTKQGVNLEGFSDHLPVIIELNEKVAS